MVGLVHIPADFTTLLCPWTAAWHEQTPVRMLLQAAKSTALSEAHADAEVLRASLAAAESAAKERAAAAEASAQREAELQERVQILEANLSTRHQTL